MADEIRQSARNKNDANYIFLDKGKMPIVDEVKPKTTRKKSVVKDALLQAAQCIPQNDKIIVTGSLVYSTE